MLTLNKNQLAVLDQTQQEYVVTLQETDREGARWWLMRVTLPLTEKVFVIVTALGQPKAWKRLDIAVDYIKESCPNTKTVVVLFAPPTPNQLYTEVSP